MSRLAKGLLSPLAGDGASRHGVSTPLEVDVLKNIPYITHEAQAIQLPFGRGPFLASAPTISSYRYSNPKALSLSHLLRAPASNFAAQPLLPNPSASSTQPVRFFFPTRPLLLPNPSASSTQPVRFFCPTRPLLPNQSASARPARSSAPRPCRILLPWQVKTLIRFALSRRILDQRLRPDSRVLFSCC